jgi:glycosyltransferase involved in cell wall biosynthesis
MRIAVFTDTDFDAPSGATSTLRALVEHAPEDLPARIYTFADLEVDAPDHAAMRRSGLLQLARLASRLTREDVRVLHVASSGWAGVAAGLLSRRTALPLVGSVHGSVDRSGGRIDGTPSAAGSALAAAVRRWIYGRCRRVLMPSRSAMSRAGAGGWSDARCVLWPRGVDSVRFAPGRRSPSLREAWHVSDRRPAILVAGRVAAEKGLALLEPLSAQLHCQRAPHRLIVLGDGPMLRLLRERCPDACFMGRLRHDEVPAVMASADLIVHPAATDTGCSVLLEAQASGLPVLAAGTGSARENMRPGITGYTCRAGDVAELAARAAALLVDRDHRQEMGRAARAYAQTRSWSVSLAPVYDLHRRAAAGTLTDPTEPAADRTAAPRLGAMPSHRHRIRAGQR